MMEQVKLHSDAEFFELKDIMEEAQKNFNYICNPVTDKTEYDRIRRHIARTLEDVAIGSKGRRKLYPRAAVHDLLADTLWSYFHAISQELNVKHYETTKSEEKKEKLKANEDKAKQALDMLDKARQREPSDPEPDYPEPCEPTPEEVAAEFARRKKQLLYDTLFNALFDALFEYDEKELEVAQTLYGRAMVKNGRNLTPEEEIVADELRQNAYYRLKEDVDLKETVGGLIEWLKDYHKSKSKPKSETEA